MRKPTCIAIVLIALLALPGSGLAGITQQSTVNATAMFQDSFRLTAGSMTEDVPLRVDTAASLTVTVSAPAKNLSVSLVSPGGTVYSVGTAVAGAFASTIVPDPTLNPANTANYIMTLTNPVTGLWTVRVSTPTTPTTPIDVLVLALFENQTRAVLLGGGETYPTASSIRLALAAFDGTAKIAGLAVSARLYRPGDAGFTPVMLTFNDAGSAADTVAADRIYNAFAVAPSPGTYQVDVTIDGSASTGTFRRTVAAEFKAVNRDATLDGSFTDRGIDANSDALLDEIGVAPHGTVTTPGSYNVSVRLHASNGNEMERTVHANLPAGSASPEVTFDAVDVRAELGVDGPYEVRVARWDLVGASDVTPADIRYTLGSTQAYSLSQLQRAAIEVSALSASTGIDLNANTLYDKLRVAIPVNVTTAGSYAYTLSLADRRGVEVDFVSSSAIMVTGANSLQIDFSGSKIGANGVSGQFTVRNLLIFGSSASAISTIVGTTASFQANQFEDFQPPRGDTNADGAITPGDIFFLINNLFAGGPPPTARGGDVNGDGSIDASDIFYLINYLFSGGPEPVI